MLKKLPSTIDYQELE
nr:unnamed protein product [Callosobruchus analis]